MRITIIKYGILFAALSLIGCAADVGDRSASLRRIDESAMISQVLYVVPSSEVPLTAAQLDEQNVERTLAIPVRVEIFDDVAVAWYAPDGVALIGRDNVIALWQVVQREYIDDELAPEEVVEAQDPTVELAGATLDNAVTAPGTFASEIEITDWEQPIEDTIIHFVDQIGSYEEAWMMAQVAEGHPGCL
jgi:hypothetical protein